MLESHLLMIWINRSNINDPFIDNIPFIDGEYPIDG